MLVKEIQETNSFIIQNRIHPLIANLLLILLRFRIDDDYFLQTWVMNMSINRLKNSETDGFMYIYFTLTELKQQN